MAQAFLALLWAFSQNRGAHVSLAKKIIKHCSIKDRQASLMKRKSSHAGTKPFHHVILSQFDIVQNHIDAHISTTANVIRARPQSATPELTFDFGEALKNRASGS